MKPTFDVAFNSEEEEPEIKKTFKKTATYTNEISFNSSKIKKEYNQNKIEVNPSKLDHLIEEGGKHSKSKTVYNKDDKKKKESNKKLEKEKPYQFDLMKYKTQDIALELTRISYALYSKIKIGSPSKEITSIGGPIRFKALLKKDNLIRILFFLCINTGFT